MLSSGQKCVYLNKMAWWRSENLQYLAIIYFLAPAQKEVSDSSFLTDV